MTEHDQLSAELVPVTRPRSLDLRDAATDSWTDVVEEVGTLAGRIADTEFVPDSLRGNGAAVAAAILSGREVGMAPMTALATINVIKGKPAVSAEAMRGLVLQAGHQIIVTESSSSRVIMKGRRRGYEEWSAVTWTLDDAKRAGLRGDNWTKYPRQMLTARATTELCRLIFADVIHGLRSVEEMADAVESVTEVAPAEPARTTTVQRKRPTKKAAAKPEPAAEQQADPPPRKRVDLPPPKAGEPGRTAGADDPAPLKTSPPSDGGVSDGDEDGPEDNVTVPPSGPSTPAEQYVRENEAIQTELNKLADKMAAEGKQPPAGDESQQGKENPDVGTDESEDGIVDAEIVTGRSSGPKITAAQRAALQMHFRRLGVDDRDEYLLIANLFLELEPGTIGSTNELRGDEPQRLMAILERLKDRDALDQRLAGQDQLT